VREDAHPERLVAVEQRTAVEAAVNGVPRLVCLLEPVLVPPFLDDVDEGETVIVRGTRSIHERPRLVVREREVNTCRHDAEPPLLTCESPGCLRRALASTLGDACVVLGRWTASRRW
jgi:hypothetical protein